MAIVQSNYIPWKGYFDLINLVDEFILFDDMQYTRRDWRNRNVIKSPNGLTWLTIPVQVKGKYFQKIKDTVISDPEWNRNHWKSIVHGYNKARYFSAYREPFEDLYLGIDESFLSRINYRFLTLICRLLGIETKISWSMDYHLAEGKTERLVDLCKRAGAQEYISGPAAGDYIDESLFRREGIALRYMDYSGYPEYDQLFPPFEHGVSILDLIFNEGPDATRYMKTF
ncbi:MAG TPA: WbqC family protein [Pyrinomonadaceae bacterium]|nr:WbqC family protein [Pyrinomonadaceae bacterium]